MTYKLVPAEPTREMLAAAGDAVVALNSQHHDAIKSAVYEAMLAAAPEIDQDLVGWVVVGPGDCMSDIQTDHCHAVDLKSDMDSELPPHHAGPAHEVKPLYLRPRPEDGTTSDKYRAELYDEVWQRARDMGYANVTMALDDLAARTQPAPDQFDDVPTHPCIMQLDNLGDL